MRASQTLGLIGCRLGELLDRAWSTPSSRNGPGVLLEVSRLKVRAHPSVGGVCVAVYAGGELVLWGEFDGATALASRQLRVDNWTRGCWEERLLRGWTPLAARRATEPGSSGATLPAP